MYVQARCVETHTLVTWHSLCSQYMYITDIQSISFIFYFWKGSTLRGVNVVPDVYISTFFDFMNSRQVAVIAITVRVLQAVLTRTFLQPDEYFQSLEVAHRAVFSYGHLTWEWQVEKPIRSIIFPSLWIPVYWVLKVTGLHQTSALVSHCTIKIASCSWMVWCSDPSTHRYGLQNCSTDYSLLLPTFQCAEYPVNSLVHQL
jgi:hypothetical protein